MKLAPATRRFRGGFHLSPVRPPPAPDRNCANRCASGAVAVDSKGQIIRDGAVAVLGAATVAVWFLLFDFSRGSPLETPAVLAAVLFHGGIARAHICARR